MPSFIDQFESEFTRGDLDDVSHCALPFLRNHWADLKIFVDRFRPLLGDEELDIIIKLFILHYNMPFDMGVYMKSQRKFIEDTVQNQHVNDHPDARREAVAHWIHENAQRHRHEAILKQVLCFEKIKKDILPLIRKALHNNSPDLLT